MPDGTKCDQPLLLGFYCSAHESALTRDIEIFKVVSEHFRQDLREFWQRSNFYLIVDAALVSFFASTGEDDVHAILGILGLVVSLFWYVVARGSIIWLRYWRDELRSIDELVDRLQVFHRVEQKVRDQPWNSPSWITQWLPLVFVAGWLAMLLNV